MSSSEAFTRTVGGRTPEFDQLLTTDLFCWKNAAKVAIRTSIEPSKLQAGKASAAGCRRLLVYYQEVTRTLERECERGQTTNSESIAFAGDSAALCVARSPTVV